MVLTKLAEIEITRRLPGCLDMVLVRYETSPGGDVDTIAGLVIRPLAPAPNAHFMVNVVPIGDGDKHGPSLCPISGAGDPLRNVYLFDGLSEGKVPDVPVQRREQFAGKRVWCEWRAEDKRLDERIDRTQHALIQVQNGLAALRKVEASNKVVSKTLESIEGIPICGTGTYYDSGQLRQVDVDPSKIVDALKPGTDVFDRTRPASPVAGTIKNVRLSP